MTHKCDKEKELTEMHDKLISIEIKVKQVHTALMGNGRRGLLEKWSELNGGLAVWKWIAGSGLIGSVVAIVMFVFG